MPAPGLWYHHPVASPRDWLVGSPLRIGVLSGALFATLQVVRHLVTDDGPINLVFGVLGGVVFGALVGRATAKETQGFAGLTREQRSEIARAIRCGEAPRDPALAKPTIEWARRLQKQHERRWPLLMFGALALISFGLAVSNALDGSLTMGGVLLVVFWLVLLPLMWWQGRLWGTRARRAEASARRLEGTGPLGS